MKIFGLLNLTSLQSLSLHGSSVPLVHNDDRPSYERKTTKYAFLILVIYSTSGPCYHLSDSDVRISTPVLFALRFARSREREKDKKISAVSLSSPFELPINVRNLFPLSLPLASFEIPLRSIAYLDV